MRSSLIPLTILASLAVLGLACDHDVGSSALADVDAATQPPPAQFAPRILSIDITQAENQEYDDAVRIIRQAGAQSTCLSLQWDDLETAPGEFHPDPNWLSVANAYYPTVPVRLSLMIGAIDTNRRRTPSDLAGRPFDDPEVIRRYLALLDYVLAQVPDIDLTCLALGNEVDAYLSGARWNQYQALYEAAVAHCKEVRPDLPVGVKATLGGLTGGTKRWLQKLNRRSGVIMVTYYPLESDFTVKDTSVVAGDLEALVALYPDRPVFIMEAGYPSSPVCRSSEAKQASFIREMFKVWDAHAGQIRLIDFTWLSDLPQSSVDSYKEYYGLASPGFAEYLRTLGLRTYPNQGHDKAALKALREEARARGFSSQQSPAGRN